MSVPKHTTPPPAQYYRSWNDHNHDDDDADATPAWINSPDGPRQAARGNGRYGQRARLTALLKPDEPPPLHPFLRSTTFKTLDVCWDCDGRGKTGSILRRCPYCGVGYTAEQLEALARRDPWGKWILPCGDPPVPSVRLKPDPELCPTCKGQPIRGHIVLEHTMGELLDWFMEHVRKNLGLTESDLPRAFAAFAGSEPSAPTPHLAPGVLTPHLPPLAPDDGTKF